MLCVELQDVGTVGFRCTRCAKASCKASRQSQSSPRPAPVEMGDGPRYGPPSIPRDTPLRKPAPFPLQPDSPGTVHVLYCELSGGCGREPRMHTSDDMLIRVHGAWDGWRHAEVRLRDLQIIHWLQPERAPQRLLHGYVLCSGITAGDIPHDCGALKPRTHCSSASSSDTTHRPSMSNSPGALTRRRLPAPAWRLRPSTR
jgi:hypothetical protein